MNLTIHGRNLDVSDHIEEYIQKKIGRLDRYLPTLKDARVDIGEEKTRNSAQHYVVQVTLYDRHGSILRGEERGAEITPAIDEVVDKMHRQIERFKGKRKDRYQRGHSNGEVWEEPLTFEEEEDEDEEEREIVRTKRFAISPMNTEEAIEQMELLGHSFFVYYDVDHAGVNVVYRRHDGNYGLIIPELA